MSETFKCPICDFDMPYPPKDYNICPQCMCEFGNDDADFTHNELRARWNQRGMGQNMWNQQ